MADVSPSNTKVNDFLSSLSQLSQDKLREDQERQQRLQRNIDELQRRLRSTSPIKSSVTVSSVSLGKSHYGYSVPELKFNRSKVTEVEVSEEEEEGPELPRRPVEKAPPPLPRRKYKEEDAPALPKRRYQKEEEEEEEAPALPKRKSEKDKDEEEINLLNPVPRKSSFPIPKQTPSKPTKPAKPASVKPDFKVERPAPGQHRSFRDIENIIKSSEPSTTKPAPPRPAKKVDVPVEPKTPAKPVKSDWLTSLASAKTTTFTPQSPESKKGSKSHVLPKPKAKDDLEDEEAEFILKFKELKPAKKPVLPKPKPIVKSSPVVPLAKKPIEKQLKPVGLTETKNTRDVRSFETKEEAEFKSKFEKLKTGPVPPKKPKTLTSFNEPPPEFQNKFNKIAAKSPQKLQRPATTGSLGNYKEKDTAELRSQLEKLVSARNKGGPPAVVKSVDTVREVTPKKSDTQSSEEKLVHPTKSRTKGPKRRLPKTMLKKEDVKPVQQPVVEIKKKKVGPPINKHTKPKEVGELKPSIAASGDFFI
ncbi:hypothetical protein Cantr_10422 [Candida viswanathii]|uniref:Uncharacterized protein n=1 Tax=Candida viswanathii TaxID=5486 RepID=A0A367YEF4_9ASCO|nr:hypothetical protein Cantr_10422 [Candida viswanathii]